MRIDTSKIELLIARQGITKATLSKNAGSPARVSALLYAVVPVSQKQLARLLQDSVFQWSTSRKR